jgi:hypothetical protein
MTFIRGMPNFSPSFPIAMNLSTIGRTLRGLQLKMPMALCQLLRPFG